MSSAVAMVLVTAMAIPGSGPEKLSGETERGLDLRGHWRVTYSCISGQTDKWLAIVEGGHFNLRSEDKTLTINYGEVRDEGCGDIRWTGGPRELLGIYRQDGDQVIVCLREANSGRPTSFSTKDNQDIMILRRVKPHK